MAYKAIHRHARISARKVRPLADLIRGKAVDDALSILRYQPQRGARMLEKLIKSALGNAEDLRAPNVGGLVVAAWRMLLPVAVHTFRSRWNDTMGQKINPISFRTGIMIGWKSRWYASKKEFAELLLEDHKIRKYVTEKYKFAGI